MNRTLSPTITVSAAGVTVNAVVESVDGAFDPFAPNGSRSALEQAAHTTAAAASDAMNAVFMSAPSWGDETFPFKNRYPGHYRHRHIVWERRSLHATGSAPTLTRMTVQPTAGPPAGPFAIADHPALPQHRTAADSKPCDRAASA